LTTSETGATDRPLSARSGMTMNTMLTGAHTQFSSKTKEEMKEVEQIMKKINDKKSKLVDFLKYDSSLGRDQ
jgi:hypothetical protein